LFPIGEVNGSHGVYRPGGSALNSGQVAAFRAAEYIAVKYHSFTVSQNEFDKVAEVEVGKLKSWLENPDASNRDWQTDRDEFQNRMSAAGAHIRTEKNLKKAVAEAWEQYNNLRFKGMVHPTPEAAAEALRNLQLCLAHVVYLEATLKQVQDGVGSRGSALTLSPNGQECHEALGDEWKFQPENAEFREKVLETYLVEEGKVENAWISRRPLPECDGWFETIWGEFNRNEIYDK
jgi:hypothetical protein